MQPLRIAVATAGFRQPLKQAVRTAAGMGAQGVQFDVRNELRPEDLSETGRRQFLHLLDDLRQQVASLHLPTRRAFYDVEGLDARLEATRNALQFAYQLGARVVTVRVGRLPGDLNSHEGEVLRQVLSDIARFGNHVGATLALIPSSEPPAALHEFVTSITEGMIAIDFDPATFILHGQDPIDAMRALHASIIHIEARDAVRHADGTGVEVPIGRGDIDWTEFLALVQEIDYRGWVTVNRTQGDDRLRETANAVQYLREVGYLG